MRSRVLWMLALHSALGLALGCGSSETDKLLESARSDLKQLEERLGKLRVYRGRLARDINAKRGELSEAGVATPDDLKNNSTGRVLAEVLHKLVQDERLAEQKQQEFEAARVMLVETIAELERQRLRTDIGLGEEEIQNLKDAMMRFKTKVRAADETGAPALELDEMLREELKKPLRSGSVLPSTTPGEVVTNSIGAKLVYVPAGVLPALEERKAKVTISQGLLVGVFEATQGECEAVLKRNPSWFSPTGGGKDKISGLAAAEQRRLPVENVTWFDCVEFCNELSKKEGLKPYYTLASVERNEDQSIKSATVTIAGGNGYRLLTEAEWEYCCRAGTTTRYHFGDVNNGREANVDGNYPDGTVTKGPYLARTTPVGGYPANKFGLHDMHGNVWEWCWDGYASYRDADTTDCSGSSGGTSRVLRGGSWLTNARSTRSAFRINDAPDDRYNYRGFRFARTS